MKGTFFQKPVEFKIEVAGESWHQGAPLSGKLMIKNHGTEVLQGSDVPVRLAYGVLKKVRAKAPSSLSVLAEASAPAGWEITPGAEGGWEWSFRLDRNVPVTDASASLFLIYGRGAILEQLGQLQLNIAPSEAIEVFLKAWTIHFRFVLKSIKFATRRDSGWVEAKLAPPSAREFAFVEHVIAAFREDQTGGLDVRVTFAIKKLEATAASLQSTREKREFSARLEASELRVPSGRFNTDAIEAVIAQAVAARGLPE